MVGFLLLGDRDSFDHANHNSSNSTGHQSNREMEVQRFPDTIFIQGLPDDTTEDMLVQHFGTIGKLKVRGFFTFRIYHHHVLKKLYLTIVVNYCIIILLIIFAFGVIDLWFEF